MSHQSSKVNERAAQAVAEGWTMHGVAEGCRMAARTVFWLSKPDGTKRRIIGTSVRVISDETFASELTAA